MNEKFITFEGGEGAGKTSVIQQLSQILQDENVDFITTREPGGIKISESIRHIILDTNNKEMDGRTEALLYAAARRQHLVERVIPALELGKIVLCDRFLDSSLVYQGIARRLGLEEVYAINSFAIENSLPKLTFYFDIEPEKGLARIAQNKEREINRLDQENLEFHYKVREGYLKLLEMFPERIIKINADRPLEEVVDETKEKLFSYLNIK
ncbi:dTMP kinase [Anaerobacillus alkaliphilus]|uniref:Thymidylate kinase n=1 Tax=Anaerobacillus alkaliphilus TaxID=1548597 RepID=A0A4Q0VUA6_9BACI|nr:dTMP kinase [Anaerobacillus alkaliphilus]RXJ00888.1 dTMP kinase [Anaerobacillus alkaliphilus]